MCAPVNWREVHRQQHTDGEKSLAERYSWERVGCRAERAPGKIEDQHEGGETCHAAIHTADAKSLAALYHPPRMEKELGRDGEDDGGRYQVGMEVITTNGTPGSAGGPGGAVGVRMGRVARQRKYNCGGAGPELAALAPAVPARPLEEAAGRVA